MPHIPIVHNISDASLTSVHLLMRTRLARSFDVSVHTPFSTTLPMSSICIYTDNTLYHIDGTVFNHQRTFPLLCRQRCKMFKTYTAEDARKKKGRLRLYCENCRRDFIQKDKDYTGSCPVCGMFISVYRCRTCGHMWRPKKAGRLPGTCPNPKCRSPYWCREYIRDE